jgi:hypothetical protein
MGEKNSGPDSRHPAQLYHNQVSMRLRRYHAIISHCSRQTAHANLTEITVCHVGMPAATNHSQQTYQRPRQFSSQASVTKVTVCHSSLLGLRCLTFDPMQVISLKCLVRLAVCNPLRSHAGPYVEKLLRESNTRIGTYKHLRNRFVVGTTGTGCVKA